MIRDAEERDVPFLAWVMQAAARSHLPTGVWDIVFPGPDGPRLARLEALLRSEPRSYCHYGPFLVAERGGRPAAALCGYHPRHEGSPAMAAALRASLEAAEIPEAEILRTFARFAPILTCAPETPEDLFVVEWVATRPEHRRQGLVRELLQAVLDRGRVAGFREAQISFVLGNEPARRAYERAGFRTVAERKHPEFERVFGSPGIATMRRPLAAGPG